MSEVISEFRDIGWKPEDYGFIQIIEGKDNTKAAWKKFYKDKAFVLIRLSDTLFVVKKELRTTNNNGVKEMKLLVKWHMVIDSKELADIYLTKGLRG
jgi:hypothetical protein